MKYFSRKGQSTPDDTDSFQFRELILGAIVSEVLSGKSQDYSQNLYIIEDIFDLLENKDNPEFDEEGFKAEAKAVIKKAMKEPLGSILTDLTFQKEYADFTELSLQDITDRDKVKELLRTKRGERPPIMEPSEDFISLDYIKKTYEKVQGYDLVKKDGKTIKDNYDLLTWNEIAPFSAPSSSKKEKGKEYHPESKLGWLQRHPEYSAYITPSPSPSSEVKISTGKVVNKSDKEKLFDHIESLKEKEDSNEFNQMVDEIVAYQPKEEESSEDIESDDSLTEDEKLSFSKKIGEKYPKQYVKLFDREYFYKGKNLFDNLYNTSPLEEDEISEERSGNPELVKEAFDYTFSYIRKLWPTEWNLYNIQLKLYKSEDKFSFKFDKTHELFQTGPSRGTGGGEDFKETRSTRLLPFKREYNVKNLRNFIEEIVEEYRDLKEILG